MPAPLSSIVSHPNPSIERIVRIKKKRNFLLLSFDFFILGVFFCFFSGEKDPINETYCAFCDECVITSQKFYEDSLVLALLSHKPIYPGHSLIIPKRHVERFDELTNEEVTRIGQIIQKVHQASAQILNPSSYLLVQKMAGKLGNRSLMCIFTISQDPLRIMRFLLLLLG